MAGIQPPQRGPRGGRRGDRRRVARRQIRLRQAGLAAAVAGLVLVVVVLLDNAGSHGHAHSPSAGAHASVALAHQARSGSHVAGGPGAGSAESSQIRKLVALGKPIYCAGRRGNEVALTFDDGPGPYTRLMLAKLRKHRVHATFFIVGRNIDLVAGAVREERVQGAVGDHTFTHPLLTSLTDAQAENEIVRTQTALARASASPVFLFRPPYGAHNAQIDAIARAHGLLQILWTVDSADSLGANYAQIERNVISGLHAGAIILMHENHGQTVRAMLSIFAALQSKHLRAVSVAQLLTDDPPSVAQVQAGGGACGVHGALSGG